MMGFGGNEMNVGFTRRIMGSIHARNNPSMLRPDHAVRMNTRAAMSRAQSDHAGDPYDSPLNSGAVGEVGSTFGHSRGGALRGTARMRQSNIDAQTRYLDTKAARESSSRLDPNRPTRGDVRNAKRDMKELEKFAGTGSESYGIKENTSTDGPRGAQGTSTVNQGPFSNTPGPVMKKVLPTAYAAGKAIGKRKAAKQPKFEELDDPY